MAELLIYTRKSPAEVTLKGNPNWLMERQIHIDSDPKMNTRQKIRAKELVMRKFNGRSVPGDILEVRDDGRPRGKKELEIVRFLRVPGSKDSMKHYEKSAPGEDGQVLLKHRYQIDMTGLVFDETGTTQITKADFLKRVKDKSK